MVNRNLQPTDVIKGPRSPVNLQTSNLLSDDFLETLSCEFELCATKNKTENCIC